ncbi:MAG: hypothetical protein V9G04_18935 [Nocardioides sp.]
MRALPWRRIKYAVFLVLLLFVLNGPLVQTLSAGREPSGLMWFATAAVDAALLLFAYVLLRYGRYSGGDPVRASAVAAVEPATVERGIDELGDDLLDIRGDVLTADAHEMVLDVDGVPVVVILDGHANELTRGRVARVRARRI